MTIHDKEVKNLTLFQNTHLPTTNACLKDKLFKVITKVYSITKIYPIQNTSLELVSNNSN